MPDWIYLVLAIICFSLVGLLIVAIFIGWKDIKRKLPKKQPKGWDTGLPWLDD